MPTIDVGNPTNALDRARQAARALVDREERRWGSRMSAYAAVAATVGASPEWVRRFCCGYADARCDLVVGFNLLAQYERVQRRSE